MFSPECGEQGPVFCPQRDRRAEYVLMAEVVLLGSGVVAVVGELITAGMTQHVRVDAEWHLGGLTEPLDEPVEANRADNLRGSLGAASARLASHRHELDECLACRSSPGEHWP
jgi:hypothetical protein